MPEVSFQSVRNIRQKRDYAFMLALGIWLFACCPSAREPAKTAVRPEPVVAARKFEYPQARRADVVDTYHGTEVADPYRWLEDADSEETRAWVDAQNRMTSAFVRTPVREKLKARLTELWNYPRYSLPQKRGGRYFFFKNDGLQNQSVYYSQQSLDAEPKTVIDPNILSEDGTVAIRATAVSEDGETLAYGLSASGSDWQQIHIRDIDSGEEQQEVLQWCKFTSIAWKHDGSGFFYDRFPAPGTVPDEDRNNYNRVYFHKLGTPQDRDALVYEDPQNKELGFSPEVTEDGKYLVLHVRHGTSSKNRFYYREVESDRPFVRLLDKADAKYRFLGNAGATFYFHTDLDAPKGRVVAIDLKKPQPEHWRQIIAEQADVVHFPRMVGGHLVVSYLHNAHHVLKVYTPGGEFVEELELPALGSVAGVSGKMSDEEMFFGFTSFLHPPSAYRYDFKTGRTELFRGPQLDFDAGRFATEQVLFKSKDGTYVPMFITRLKDLELDGDNPTLLTGYGGFNISVTPRFSVDRVLWLENGGIHVLVNLRGGNEYGEQWHEAGMLGNKQNVFDDFISAAQWLIANRYTSADKLAVEGRSNGGLLTAACEVQRPDLFGAVISGVPVIDMLRYHKFSVGRYWVPEYGNAEENPEHFEFLYAYSPLHNIKPGTAFPPTLVTTADTDDRVVPLHGKKFAAALQAADTGDNPILLRVETKAGHGGDKPVSKRIEETADIFAFLFEVLQIEVR